MDSLPGAHCLAVRHNEKVSKKVFIALEGLSQEQFEAWKPPIDQLRAIHNGQGVIVSCAGADMMHAHHAAWQYQRHEHAGLTQGMSATHSAAARVSSAAAVAASASPAQI